MDDHAETHEGRYEGHHEHEAYEPYGSDGGRSPETVDRIMVGSCAAIWLALVAMVVLASMALVDMGRGHRTAGESSQSSWLLYSIIAVSAVILLGAVPLLLRARRTAAETAADERDEDVVRPVRPREARTEKLRVFGTSVDPYERPLPETPVTPSRVPTAVLNRLWLRGTVSLLAAMGVGLIGVAAAAYLLATASTTGAWVALGFAGVVTVAMPAVLVFFQRQLGEVVEEAGA